MTCDETCRCDESPPPIPVDIEWIEATDAVDARFKAEQARHEGRTNFGIKISPRESA